MGRDEQKEEREVLDSIFPDEITDLTESSYRVSVTLDVADAEEEQPPTLWLTINYPEAYPDEAPNLDLSAPPNAAKHPDLDIQDDKERLLESLQPVIEENLGMAMVFTLVSALKENAEGLMTERQNAVEAEREQEAKKLEEKENEKFHGTAVTRETFLEWQANFIEEMRQQAERAREEKEAEDKKRRVAKPEEKLTGKQLWERGLAGKAGEEDFEEGEDALKGMEKISIKA